MTEKPQAPRDEPEAARDEPEVARDEPEAARDEPEVARDEPEVVRDEPEVDRDAPEVVRDEPEVARDEPLDASEQPPTTAEDERQLDLTLRWRYASHCPKRHVAKTPPHARKRRLIFSQSRPTRASSRGPSFAASPRMDVFPQSFPGIGEVS